MPRIARIVLAALAATALAGGVAAAEEDVFVVNFPEVQRVEGAISLTGPAPSGRLERVAREIVAPVARHETTALVAAGTLETDGFVSAVLSVAGQVRADLYRDGAVGALLVPEEEVTLTAFEEAGQLLLPLEVEAPAARANGVYFASSGEPVRLAFPRYRVFFFNTTDRPAEVTLFAYLTN